jgi:hypothetical protein
MPYADPDRRRERSRQYRERHRDEINRRQRKSRAANLEAVRAYKRDWRNANRERVNEQARQRRQADPEHARELQRSYRERHRDEIRDRANARPRGPINAARKRRRQSDPAGTWATGIYERHGLTPGQWAAIWTSQGGRCYLCRDPLPEDRRHVHIDHDHRCCPPGRSCSRCRRGLACGACNHLVGHGKDDPARIRRIARNLGRALRRYEQAPEPLTLFDLNGHRDEPPALFDLEVQ